MSNQDTKKWRKSEISIKRLSLWDENPRFPEEYFSKSETELIEFFLKKKEFKIESFAKEVAKEFDLPQLEKIVVLQLKRKNIVLEGNRRLVVYKLLLNPSLTSDQTIRTLFEGLQKQTKISTSFKLEANITATKEEGLRFIDRKHNRGNNEVGWGEPERRNFAVRRLHGKSKDVLRVELANAVKKLSLPDAIKEAVLSKGFVTTFYRIVDSAPARRKLEYSVSDSGTIGIRNQNKFDDLLKVITYNVWTKKNFRGDDVDSRSLNKLPAIDKYISGLQVKDVTRVEKEIKESTKETLFGDQVLLTPPRTRSNQLSTDRKFLINSSIYIQNSRINAIYDELQKKVDVDSAPNAVAVLFRVFMECSIDCYIETHKIKVDEKKGLAGKILKVVDHLEDTIVLRRLAEEGNKNPTPVEFKKIKEKVKFKSMRKVATKDNNSILSVTTFHDFVHDYKVSPIPSELKKYWDNLDSFFVALWGSFVLAKKRKRG
ncbi:MAG: hypothetical protein HY617_01445 [Candidatus Sungbacteria bacterium]|nr:hypothetical protein [Candidatus Sungbacteria bacterium]